MWGLEGWGHEREGRRNEDVQSAQKKYGCKGDFLPNGKA